MTIDRSAVARALAKAIAYKQCGKQDDAEAWAAELVRLLECADILSGSSINATRHPLTAPVRQETNTDVARNRIPSYVRRYG
jgi:hypothetical protein